MKSRKSFSRLLGAAVFVLLVVFGVIGWLIWQTRIPPLPPVKAIAVPIQDRADPHYSGNLAGNTQTPSNVSMIVLAGSVLDEKEDIFRQARVLVESTQPDRSVSPHIVDDYGRFRFEIPNGSYILTTTAPEAIIAVTRAIETKKEIVSSLILHLPRARSIHGVVINDASETIAGCRIVLSATREESSWLVKPDDSSTSQITFQTVSDDSGRFELKSLWPGAYHLTAVAEHYLPHVQPSLPADDSSHTLLLRTESEIGATVINQDKQPVFMASVQLQQTEGSGSTAVQLTTSQNGSALFTKLQPGVYQIQAQHPDYEAADKSNAVVDLRSDRQDCVLVLNHKGYSISGQVLTMQSREPVPDFVVDLKLGIDAMGEAIQSVTSGAQGEFQFTNIHRGEYQIGDPYNRINKDSPYQFPIGHDVKRSVIDHDVEGVELLVMESGSVSGRVTNSEGKPVSQAIVGCFWGRERATTDEEGRYRIALHPFKDTRQNWNAKVQAYHMEYGYGESQEIACGENKNFTGVDIVLEGYLTITGKVTDKAGNPIPTASLKYYNTLLPKEQIKQTISLDSSGAYTIERAPLEPLLVAEATDYVKMIRHPKYKKGTREAREDFILLKEEESADSSIGGVVVDQNGIPMQGIQVTCNISTPHSQGMRSATTKEDGRFRFSGLESKNNHSIETVMTQSPFLKKKVSWVAVGTLDLVIRMNSEPVDVILDFDVSEVQSLIAKSSRFSVEAQPIGTIKNERVSKIYETLEEPLDDPLSISERGEYMLIIEGLPQNKDATSHFYGSQTFFIDEQTLRVIHVPVKLREEKIEQAYVALGRCVYADGSPVQQEYRLVARLLDPNLPPYLCSRTGRQDPIYPEIQFGVPIRYDGAYEFVYIYQDSVIARQVIELTYAMGTPFPGETVPVVRIPDMVLPLENPDAQ